MDRTLQDRADSADTNIYVTQGGAAPRVPAPLPMPALKPLPASPAPTPAIVPAIEETTVTEKKTINWGEVLKGVAIVTAAVVVVVVAAHLAGVLAVAAFGTHAAPTAGSTIVGAIGSMAQPPLHALSTGFTAAATYLGQVPSFAATFFSHMAGAMHLTGVSAVSVPSAAHAVAATVGAGAALAASAPVVASSLDHLNFVHHQTVTTTHDLPATATPDTAHEGNFLQSLLSSKTMATHSSMTEAGHTEAAHATSEAFEMGHHASHAAHEDHTMIASAAPSETPRKRSWTARTTTAPDNYRSTLADSGSHGAAVRATKPAGTPIAPRSSFVEELNNDSAALTAAMAK